MNSKAFVFVLFTIFCVLIGNVGATTLLTNGEAPQCMTVSLSSNSIVGSFTADDRNDIDVVVANGKVNCFSLDVKAGDQSFWVMKSSTGNPLVDFNWSQYDAPINYITQDKNKDIFILVAWQHTGYYSNTWDTNVDTNMVKSKYQTNFGKSPGVAATYTTDNSSPSIYSPHYLYDQNYILKAASTYYASNPKVHFYVPPNEGFEAALNTQDTDANAYWTGTFLPSKYASIAVLNTAWGTTFNAFADVNMPVDKSNFLQLKNWWTMKSNRLIEVTQAAAIALKSANSNKILVGLKVPQSALFINQTDTNLGFERGFDLNAYYNNPNDPTDFSSFDPYPDSNTTIQAQYLEHEKRIAYVTSLSNKPIFEGEFYPTAQPGFVSTDVNYFAAHQAQSIPYMGQGPHHIRVKD